MLYFYKSISPQPIENLNKYLDYFFTQLFRDAYPNYEHATFICADFQEIVSEYKKQIDDKLAAIFKAYMEDLQPHEKLIVKAAYETNRRIHDICNKVVTPVKYSGLPAGIKEQLKSLYDNLWGDNKVLGYARVKDMCGDVKAHFVRFREINDYVVCPFCGLERLTCKSDDGRDDYDHYLPKAKYPFITVNFENLLPMCHKCNSKGKGQKDTPFNPRTKRQRSLYYPLDTTIENHEISLNIISDHTDLSSADTWILDITCQPETNNEKKESWESIFKIQKRYKAIIADESKFWLKWIRERYANDCTNDKLPYANFLSREELLYKDYLNINSGVLMRAYQQFILNDPYCEMKLSGTLTL